jgi:hypothetical protein
VASTKSLRNSDDVTDPFIFSPKDTGSNGRCEVLGRLLTPPSSCLGNSLDTGSSYKFCSDASVIQEEVFNFTKEGVVQKGASKAEEGYWYYTKDCKIIALISASEQTLEFKNGGTSLITKENDFIWTFTEDS